MAYLEVKNCPFNCEYSKKQKQCYMDVLQLEGKTIYRVKCGCGACGPNADTMYGAIAAWNKRIYSMKQKDFKNRLKKKMTFKNFLTLLHIAKGCANDGLIINGIDVGDFIYLDMFNGESEEFLDEFEKDFIL